MFILRSNPQHLHPNISNTRLHSHCFHNLNGYETRLFIKEHWKKFNEDETRAIAEKKVKFYSFNVNVNFELAQMPTKTLKKNIDIFRLRASSLDKLASNVCDTKGIQCEKYKANMELVNISI